MTRPSVAVADLAVNEIRDYRLVNLEVVRLLDAGVRHVRLLGVEGQRLLASELRGDWKAVVEVVGRAGPEFAALVAAPNLMVIAREAADGAARGLVAGRVLIHERAGDGLGYEMAGGTVLVTGPAGHRAGLRMVGGTLIVLGPAGQLLGDRQRGGVLVGPPGDVGMAPHGQTGGRLVRYPPTGPDLDYADELDGEVFAFLPYVTASARREYPKIVGPDLDDDP